ncbi:MFS family permease [Symbiobacterium terraclitae]|uniref:MFS family permease n=1 Tax=Symbiobacterium terraclitae TaxID=557451 RepID=A0ABS4JW52_9FIRM|nr:MFS family permease [Symbiobacterium terraclitae]
MSYQPPPNGFRTFVLLWASQSVSVFGSALTLFAIDIWLVQVVYPHPEQQPQLAWSLAAVGLAMGLAQLLTTPLAGALADRLDRKGLMLAMDVVNCLVMALCAFLAVSDLLQVWTVLAVAGVFGVTNAIHHSAFDTSYAMLVTDEQLPRANGMMQTIWALSSVLSPAIAASLIALPALARQGQIPGAVGICWPGSRTASPWRWSSMPSPSPRPRRCWPSCGFRPPAAWGCAGSRRGRRSGRTSASASTTSGGGRRCYGFSPPSRWSTSACRWGSSCPCSSR